MKDSYDILISADIDEVFAVNNKEITAPVKYEDVVVKGDNRSNSLIFKINSVLDGVDISDKTFEFFYINADGYSDISPADAVSANDNYILFSWLLDSNVTAAAGEVSFIIRITGDNYVWKSKPAKIKVIDSLDVEINSPEYTPSWIQGIESRLAVLEGDNTIENLLSALRNIETTIQNDNTRIDSLEDITESSNTRINTAENTLQKYDQRISTLENSMGIDYSKIYVGVENKAPNFETITQALNYVSQHKDEQPQFDIYINTGTYNEQLYVDLPDVHLHSYTGNKDVTVTWYYGIGYTYYSADSITGRYNKEAAVNKSALSPVSDWGGTVIVTNKAENFTAENIIFENSFNKRVSEYELIDGVTANTSAYSDTSITLDRTDEDFVPTSRTATERAAAMVIRADKTEFVNCDFIGSQDTLYFGGAESARGYFSKCNIYGMTDFIFGLGNVIFQKCKLLFCGYSDTYTEKAFITANKAAECGFLFNRCTVDYDKTLNSNIPDKCFYLGRTWGAGAKTIFNKIAIFNDDFWTEMNGSIEDAFYTESKSYNGSSFIKADNIKNTIRASKYNDGFFSFTCEEWFDDWSPVSFEEEIQDVYYDFQCNNDGAYNEVFQNTTGTWKGLTIDASSGKLAPNTGANCTQMNAGTEITIPAPDTCIITVKAFQGYGANRLELTTNQVSGNLINSDTLIFLSDIEDTVSKKGSAVLSAMKDTYIESISVAYI